MKIFEKTDDIKNFLNIERQKGCSIGFVPTMGALHRGHLSLVERAREENDIVACSIFVNPKQFNNPKDLETYPRNLDYDVRLLEEKNCDVIFAPTVKEMYPEPVSEEYNFGTLQNVMEGKYREGHFNGVAVVVKRLFEIIEPHRTYFGMKDYQQLLIVKQLVKKAGLPVDIVPCETVREDDGLAMSSRNKLLTQEQRKEAGTIYKTLLKAKDIGNTLTVEELKNFVKNEINKKPSLELEYFEIVDSETLEPVVQNCCKNNIVACIAVYAGKVRLIDNMFFND